MFLFIFSRSGSSNGGGGEVWRKGWKEGKGRKGKEGRKEGRGDMVLPVYLYSTRTGKVCAVNDPLHSFIHSCHDFTAFCCTVRTA